MSPLVEWLISEALRLDPVDRAAVIEALLVSLDAADPRADRKWAAEAEDRLHDFQLGEIEAFAAEQVFEELRRS